MLPIDPFLSMKMKQFKALKSPEKEKRAVFDRLANAMVVKTEESPEGMHKRKKTQRQ